MPLIVCDASSVLVNSYTCTPHTLVHSHTLTQGYGEVMDDEDEDDDEGMDELLQNPEFLHSVFSSLPGINPEETLQNLEHVKDQQQQKDKKKVESRVLTICILIHRAFGGEGELGVIL